MRACSSDVLSIVDYKNKLACTNCSEGYFNRGGYSIRAFAVDHGANNHPRFEQGELQLSLESILHKLMKSCIRQRRVVDRRLQNKLACMNCSEGKFNRGQSGLRYPFTVRYCRSLVLIIISDLSQANFNLS